MRKGTSLTTDKVLSALLESEGHSATVAELAVILGVADDSARRRLRRMLATLVERGQVERVRRGTYAALTAPAEEVADAEDADTEDTDAEDTDAEATDAEDAGVEVADTASIAAGVAAIDSAAIDSAAIDSAAIDSARTGRITVHPAGYGFVALENGSDSVFVPAKFRGAAIDGDRVVLKLWPGYKGPEGRVVEVLERGRAKLTGVLQRAGRMSYLEPDDERIATDYGRIPLMDGAPASKVGLVALVEICQYPTEHRPALVGRLLRIIGEPGEPATEIEKILQIADIPPEFPEDVARAGDRAPTQVEISDLADRIDLRDRAFVTIDPETARDFDDALCVEDGPHGGPRVWVAVADVSHYVRTGSAIDREAALRGVSVYFPDRVIPMLPLTLSAGICSLNPEVDRCAMVVRLDFTWDGHIVDADIAAAVIRSQARMEYPGVAAALSGDFRGRRERYRPWAQSLRKLHTLAQALRKRRMARGSLDLALPEAKVILDGDDPGLIRDVVRAKGAEDVAQAYQLVEEFMIVANEQVGTYFARRQCPTVWRVHAPPEAERVEELIEILRTYGVPIDARMAAAAAEPLGMKRVLDAIGDRRGAQSLTFLLLRSLKQAVYDTHAIGHFGLASDDYLHFTSPIRRYADLLVHRQLKVLLHRDGRPSGGGRAIKGVDLDALSDLAAATSEHERRAMEAEREVVAMYRAYLMRSQIGEQLPGRITAVTNFGAFVEIDEPYVEGLLKLDALGEDFFDYDPLTMVLCGRRSGLSLRLGDSVLVEITDVSVARRQITLSLVSASGRQAPRSAKGSKRRPSARQRAVHGGQASKPSRAGKRRRR